MTNNSFGSKLKGMFTYDAWVGTLWVGMAVGDTPQEARDTLLTEMPSLRGKELMLMPFYGVRTSESTLEYLMGIRRSCSDGQAQVVDPVHHGERAYDVWLDQQYVDVLVGRSPKEVRAQVLALWPEIAYERVHLIPNYGVGYDPFEIYSLMTSRPVKILKRA